MEVSLESVARDARQLDVAFTVEEAGSVGKANGAGLVGVLVFSWMWTRLLISFS